MTNQEGASRIVRRQSDRLVEAFDAFGAPIHSRNVGMFGKIIFIGANGAARQLRYR